MMTMNRVTLLGYAGRNPEMRKLQSGDDVAQFSLATTERFRRRDETVGESTEWHSVVAFGAAAEAVRKLVRKGAPVLVEGRIASRTWTDRTTGAERRATEIVVSGPRGQVNVLARRSTGAGGDEPPGGPAAAGAASGAGPAEGGEAANGAAQAGTAGSPSGEDVAVAGAESEGTGETAAGGDEAVAAAAETGGDPPVGAGDTAGASAVGGAVGETAGPSEDAAGAAQAMPESKPPWRSTRTPGPTGRPMTTTIMIRPAVLLAAALALALWPAPARAAGEAAAGADCAPEVEQALAEGARIGVERDVAILRHPEQGIRDPDSILDFSCLEDLFDFRSFDILFDPGRSMADLLGLVQRRICSAAREAYRGYVGRPLDAALYTARTPRLPGLDPVRDIGDVVRTGSAERFRDIVGDRR